MLQYLLSDQMKMKEGLEHLTLTKYITGKIYVRPRVTSNFHLENHHTEGQ